MRLAFDIRSLISRQLTGVGGYAQELLESLLKLDQVNQYDLFYNAFYPPSSSLTLNFSHYPNARLRVFKYPNKIFNASLVFLHQPKLDRLMKGCDRWFFPNLTFWSISSNCPSMVTVHDLSFIRIPWAYSWKGRLWHKIIGPKNKLEAAAKIIAVSQNTKKDLIELYHLLPEKIEVIYPGIEQGTNDKEPFDAAQGRQRANRLRLPERFILYLGTLEPRKNVEGVVKAFEQLKQMDLYLVIAGVPGRLYRKIYRLAKNSPSGKRIIFLNYIAAEERWLLYRQAQALVWPSFYEGFGFPPLEAMAHGCPVITSANSSLAEVTGGAALLVDPYNINEISEAIKLILDNPSLREKLVEQGYEQAKKFTWEAAARKMLQVFEAL